MHATIGPGSLTDEQPIVLAELLEGVQLVAGLPHRRCRGLRAAVRLPFRSDEKFPNEGLETGHPVPVVCPWRPVTPP